MADTSTWEEKMTLYQHGLSYINGFCSTWRGKKADMRTGERCMLVHVRSREHVAEVIKMA